MTSDVMLWELLFVVASRLSRNVVVVLEQGLKVTKPFIYLIQYDETNQRTQPKTLDCTFDLFPLACRRRRNTMPHSPSVDDGKCE